MVKSSEELYNNFINSYRDILDSCSQGNSQNQIWVIKYCDKMIRLSSGKSSWKRINHAKSALRLEFYGCSGGYDYKVDNCFTRDEAKERAWQELLSSGEVSFVNILENKNGM